MKNLKFEIHSFNIVFCLLFFAFCVFSVCAQSTSQSHPTAIVTNEISGAIKPRDIGDARLTSYFYTFNGNQGDVFINVVTTNFNGDVDIFNADGLKPLTKIVIYADAASNETGRVIYFRKPEKLILRVEGRTPNDEAATYKIKFAGSFVAAANVKSDELPLPEITSSNQTDVRVNSVGTIVEIKPKPTPSPIETVAKTDEPKNVVKEISIETKDEKSVIAETDVNRQDERKIEVKESGKQLEVVVTENPSVEKNNSAQPVSEVKTEKTEKAGAPEKTGNDNQPVEEIKINETTISKTDNSSERKPEVTAAKTSPKKNKTVKAVEPKLLENIRLIVLFKDGAKIERPMSEVLRFGVDRGILTIIYKNGSIGRYSILDVTKVTIE